MKKLFSLLMVALMMGAMVGCNNNGGESKSAAKGNDSIATEFGKFVGTNLNMQMSQDPRSAAEIDKDELLKGIETILACDTTKKGKSYLNGIAMALQMIYPGIAQVEGQGIDLDRKAFMKELKKAFLSKDSVDMNKIQAMQMNLQGLMQRATKAKGDENDKAGKKYIEEKIKKDNGFKKTASGVAVKIVKLGSGAKFNDSARVDVKYVGRHINGKEFDRNDNVPFDLRQVVPGFREVITMLTPGSKAIAIIPGAQAYGEQGNPQGGIGPNETLEFEIETIGLHKDEPADLSKFPGQPTTAPKAPKAKK